MNFFSDEQLEKAKKVSMIKLAENLGYTVVKKGQHYSLKEMDSIMIYDDKTWYRFSRNYGGTQIDFLMRFANLNAVEAVEYLLKMDNCYIEEKANRQTKADNNEPKKMILPEASDNYKRSFAYLINKRCLNSKVIQYFIDKGILYEEKEFHNIVFLGRDKEGNIKYATKHGTMDMNGKCFKGDVEGNDKRYGVNIVNKESRVLNVFEAAIDMMSFCQLKNDFGDTNKLALGMLHDKPLETFLTENPLIQEINFFLDSDEPGREAAAKYERKYTDRGYVVGNYSVREGKDVNEYLQIQYARKCGKLEEKKI